MYKCILIILFLLPLANLVSQEPVSGETIGYMVKAEVVGADTIPHVNLPLITVTHSWRSKNNREKKKYDKMVINVKKTLPYARMASYKLNAINDHLATLESDKEREKYLDQAEKELFAEFEAPLRKLSFTQGKILINLIDRETGDTGYSLIKEYKGGFSAFFWQSVARVFGSNLKDEYDPDNDDRMIEHIVIQIDNGML